MIKIESVISELVSLCERVNIHPEYAELRQNIPGLYGKTVFDTLTSVPDMIIMEYSYLFQAKKYFKQEYKSFLKLSQKEWADILKLEKNSTGSVDTIYQDSLSKDELDIFIEAFESVTSFIPDRYKKNINPNVVVLKEKIISNAAFDSEKSEITVSFSDNQKNLMSEIIHEYGHLLEQENLSLKIASHKFLQKRISSNKKLKMSDLCNENGIECLPGSENIQVYPGGFISPYVGRVYGEIEDPKSNTEVISIGLQSFFLDSINFLFKDTEHFEIIYNLLKGNHE